MLADSIPADFPRLDVLDAYVKPVTSSFRVPANIYVSHGPDIGRLTALYERYFTWGSNAGIRDFIRRHVWAGLALRILVHEALCNDVNNAGQVSMPVSTLTFPSSLQVLI